ncbi:MAG TPA: hypothetical protein VG944_12795, partial [Fimbriimonas sp.]|nr:hypothetical protein [Fimbriimonas sp.]
MSFRAICCVFALSAGAAAFSELPKNAREDHEYHLVNVKWDLSFDFDKGSIVGDVTNTVVPTKDGATLLFDCPKLKIESADVNGEAAKTETNGRVLRVIPASGDVSGRKLDVHIHYSGLPEAGIYFVPADRAFPAHTDIVYTQGEMEDNRYWLPTYDDPDDKATFESFIHVPAGWKALSNGKLIDVTHSGSSDVWHWKLDKPASTYLISMVAGPYDEVVDGHDPVPVSYWVPEGLDAMGKEAFGGTDKVVQFYGKL